MNLLQRYVSHGIAIGLLVFIMLAFNLSVLAQTSEKRVLRVAFPQVDGMRERQTPRPGGGFPQ